MDLGPFKHIVDDGLELRKGAFECVDTLLDNCLEQIEPSYFITPFLLSGLHLRDNLRTPELREEFALANRFRARQRHAATTDCTSSTGDASGTIEKT